MGDQKRKRTIFSAYSGQRIPLGEHKPLADIQRDLKFEVKVRRISIILVVSWIVGGVLWAWIQAH